MRRFLFPCLLIILVAGAGCGLVRGVLPDLDRDMNREELARAEVAWQTTLGTLQALAETRVLKGEKAEKAAELVRKVRNVMEPWRANPDDTSAKELALAALSEFTAFEKSIERPSSTSEAPAAPAAAPAEQGS